MPASAWIGSTMKAAIFRVESACSSAAEIAERDGVRVGKQRAEAVAPEGVAHQGQGAAGQAVERALGVEQPGAVGVRAGELDGSLDAFAARTAEEGLLYLAPASSQSREASSPASSGTLLCSIAGPLRSSSCLSAATMAGWLWPVL